jgi:signal peptidase II
MPPPLFRRWGCHFRCYIVSRVGTAKNDVQGMETRKLVRTIAIVIILASNIGCDQVSKSLVRERLDKRERVELAGDYFILTRVENTGAFLSMGNSLPVPLRITLLSVLPALIMIYGLYFLFTKRSLSWISILGLCFIIGGGIGNLYDRIVYGSVTDFLHMDFVIFRTGIFNMADVSIMIGTALILFHALLKQRFEGLKW